MSTQKMQPAKQGCEKWQSNASTMAEEFRIPYLNAFWIMHRALCKATLEDIIDTEKDSLRFYYLGNKYQTKIEHIGVDRGIALDQPLIL